MSNTDISITISYGDTRLLRVKGGTYSRDDTDYLVKTIHLLLLGIKKDRIDRAADAANRAGAGGD